MSPAWIAGFKLSKTAVLWSKKSAQTRMVEPFLAQLPKLTTRVRFPSPAPMKNGEKHEFAAPQK
jgi:hypothetical protein